MKRKDTISLILLVAGLASLAVCNLGIGRGDAVAPVPLAQLGLAVDHSEQAQPIAAQMPTFFVVGAEGEDNTRKNVRLWDWAKLATGGQHIRNFAQETGDCVSQGTRNAAEYFNAAAIGKGILNSEYHEVYPPYTYGGSRVIIGKGRLGRSAGSVGAWAAEFTRKYGVLRADIEDVPPYSGKIADEWGYKGPPKDLIEAAKTFTFETVAPVRSAKDVRDAICNGYPVTIASDFGTTKIVVKDGRRVAIRNTKWYHQMCLVGYDGSASQPYYYCVNSWGVNAHPQPLNGEPPGGFWITENDIEYIVRQDDSYAYSGFEGFPANDFIPDFSVIGAAGPSPIAPVSETPAMFPLSPDIQIPGTLFGVALLIAAAYVFLRGNGVGRLGVVALAAAMLLPSLTQAQEASPVDFNLIVASAGRSEMTTVQFDELVNPMFSALIQAAEEPCPIEFNVLTEEASKSDKPQQSEVAPKPAVKPSREVIDYTYPTRSNHWTHPGTIRQHVQQGMHAGKLTADQVALMSDAELKSWHDDDHEGRSHSPAKVVNQVANYNGFTRFIWTDGTTRDTPQPGAYYPTAGGVLVPSTTVSKPVMAAPIYQTGGCPGGVCPVNRSSVFRIFRRG